MELDPVILGTNPLNGISHFSSRSARVKFEALDDEKVTQVIDASLSAGASGVNFSPNSRLYRVLDRMKEMGYEKRFGVYLMLPDMERFRSAMLTGGTMAVVRELFSGLRWGDRLTTAAKGAQYLLSSDYSKLLQVYLELEYKRLYSVLPKGGKLRCVLAHEQLTDLAVALGGGDILKQFVSLAVKMQVMPGFVTRNYPLLVRFLDRWDVDPAKVVIMTPFNKIGFQMTPDRETCESTLSRLPDSKTIGMSILAGGQLSLHEAIDYLQSVHTLASVVVGVSSAAHANETMSRLHGAMTH
jgi:hypothetical protein